MNRSLKAAGWLAAAYFLISYGAAPFFWKHYEHHRELEDEPKRARTSEGIEGDPLNVGFVATADELLTASRKAGWVPADPLSFRSDLKVAEGVLFRRSYPRAPMSQLYLYSRPQDMAFEKEVGQNPIKRHHVRLWQTKLVKEGRPLWIGTATFDRSVGVSRNTGEVTHHIDADIDKERDLLMEDLARVKQLAQISQVTGVGPTLNGRNGGGDRYYTDGETTIGLVSPGNRPAVPDVKPNPAGIQVKNTVFDSLRGWLAEQA